MPQKSIMPDAPQLSRRAKFIHIIRRICSSRPLGHIRPKKKLNHSQSRRQAYPDMATVSSDASHQHHGSTCPSSSSPESCLPTSIPKTIILKSDSVSLKDEIKICTENETVIPVVTQSPVYENIILPREDSFTHEIDSHYSTTFMTSETHENYFYNKYMDMATSELPNWHTNFDFWAEIPHEIALGIFFYLSPKELVRVSIVNRRFHNLCYDGQLWMSFDASKFYKEISAESLMKILVSAGSFVKTLNLRGCIQVEHYKRAEAVAKACNNLINITLEGCRNFQHSTLHSLLMRNIKLVNLNLTGLVAVTNGTCKIIVQTCPRLESLDISGCIRMDARGIRMLVQGCKKLKDLRTREIRGIDCIELAQDIFETNVLERLVFSGCTDLTDQALRTMMHGKDPEIDILTNLPLVPMRKLRYLDISRCHRITDFGIKSLAHLTFDLQGLLLSGCSRIGNEGLKDVVTSTPHLTHLDLEELSNLTNDFFKEVLAKAPCALTLKHLSISCCDQVGDPGMVPIFRSCTNLQNVELDNTNISDLVLSEAANMLQSRRKIKMGPISCPIIGLRLVVYDCHNVTWAGIREIMSRNSDVQKSNSDEIPAQITELISLRCYYCWQMTVDEHTKRLVRGDLLAAHRLEKLWADWIISNEETSAHGSGIRRRRRRRVRDARIIHTIEERGDRNRQRTRVILNTSGCAIM
ncbi:F-box/LRR-repeat protein 2 [Erysiphe neolycopersici]|uniref:F-box/LRR-repeat protein 2 n=1 Tax=Erysiphe neolycopersici TaxID=212602 RepID=A0A420I2K4_9PEZI|nr:F-box/LRR-repeat protein 2 [Erysiphe neolycopersici]